jgi:hypothetical protein
LATKTLLYGVAALRKGDYMQAGDSRMGDSGTGDSGVGDRKIDETEARPSAIVRNLGLIKAAAIVMGVLIIVLTAVVIGTIASRLAKMSAPPETISLTIPDGRSIRSASADEGGFVLIVDGPGGSEIWRLSPAGEREQTIRIISE